MIGKCGINCSLCPAFIENIKDEKHQQKIKQGFLKYHNLYIEEARCDGCNADDYDESVQLNPECEIRACVVERNLENCGHCASYPCDEIKGIFEAVEEISRFVKATSRNEDDYNTFVKPFIGKPTLDKIHEEHFGLENKKEK